MISVSDTVLTAQIPLPFVGRTPVQTPPQSQLNTWFHIPAAPVNQAPTTRARRWRPPSGAWCVCVWKRGLCSGSASGSHLEEASIAGNARLFWMKSLASHEVSVGLSQCLSSSEAGLWALMSCAKQLDVRDAEKRMRQQRGMEDASRCRIHFSRKPHI